MWLMHGTTVMHFSLHHGKHRFNLGNYTRPELVEGIFFNSFRVDFLIFCTLFWGSFKVLRAICPGFRPLTTDSQPWELSSNSVKNTYTSLSKRVGNTYQSSSTRVEPQVLALHTSTSPANSFAGPRRPTVMNAIEKATRDTSMNLKRGSLNRVGSNLLQLVSSGFSDLLHSFLEWLWVVSRSFELLIQDSDRKPFGTHRSELHD
jgi:hypothetical protein